MPVRAQAPEACASANSATAAGAQPTTCRPRIIYSISQPPEVNRSGWPLIGRLSHLAGGEDAMA